MVFFNFYTIFFTYIITHYIFHTQFCIVYLHGDMYEIYIVCKCRLSSCLLYVYIVHLNYIILSVCIFLSFKLRFRASLVKLVVGYTK